MLPEFEEFAAARSARLNDFDREIRPIVARAMQAYADGEADWYDAIVTGASVLWLETFDRTSPTGTGDAILPTFKRELTDSLKKTSQPDNPPTEGQIDRVANWVGVYAVNSATNFASRDAEHIHKTWVTMHDDRVRETHQHVDGQTVGVMSAFTVGGFKLQFPGEPVGPPEIWINCRCLIATTGGPEMGTRTTSLAASAGEATAEPDVGLSDDDLENEPLVDDDTETPFHGVLVVEGSPTGDKRQFDAGALTHSKLPMPISYQRASSDGHGGSVVVGRIDTIERVGSEMRTTGAFNLNTPEAHEVIDGIIFGSHGGVSVDVDSTEFELEFDEELAESDDPLEILMGGGAQPLQHFTAGRIRGASILALPAFDEAYIALGPSFDEDLRDPEAGVDGAVQGEDAVDTDNYSVEAEHFKKYDAEARKRAASSGNAMPDGSFPINDVEDLKNAIQAIGRAKDPAKAKAHIKKRARALGHPELIPESWGLDHEEALVAAATFAPGTHDGPGWLTHPRDTERLRKYWIHGEGALKIKWGVPGDFNRCRRHLGKYVNPAFLAGTCANLHKEAIGVWPGRELPGNNGNNGHHSAVALVASGAAYDDDADHALFERPAFEAITPLTLEGDHIYGHLAAWGTCHLGIGEKCVMPPTSPSNYSYYTRGLVDTDQGPVRTGPLVMWTGHAGTRLSAYKATQHYDNTGHAVADLAVGEDEFGIWFSGKLREDVTDEERRVLRASAVSGDWRDVNRIGEPNEMVGLIAVNNPGFPIPRVGFAMDGDRQLSLVASGGLVLPRKDADVSVTIGQAEFRITAEDIAAIQRGTADELERRAERRERIASARDDALVEEARNRRAERIAAARDQIEE